MTYRRPTTAPCPACGRVVAKRAGRLVNHYMKVLTQRDLTEITFGRAIRPGLCPGSGKKPAPTRRGK